MTFYAGSPYYEEVKELTLTVEGAVFCDKEESTVEVDLKNKKVKNLPDFVVLVDVNTKEQIIPIMSKLDLSEIEDLQVETVGGTYDFTYEIEERDYTLDDYKWYNLILQFTNINYEKDMLSVNEIKLYTTQDQYIALHPDQCQFVKIDGQYSMDGIFINGTPLKIPSDMTFFPIELSSEKELLVKNIFLTNDQLHITKYSYSNGQQSVNMQEIKLTPSEAYDTVNIYFDPIKDGLRAYKSYGTSIILEYELDGRPYYTTPPVITTYYNPFNPDFDTIEKYYKEVISKGVD